MQTFVITLAILSCTLFAAQKPENNNLKLWYTKPAQKWTEALQKILFLLMLTIFSWSSFAQTTQFASPFTNNMVLQRNTSAKILGSDAPNAKVSIITSWNNKSYTSKSDSEGKWSVLINTPEGSETAYTVTLQGSETVTLTNVLIGEVWICSGQSNMEMPVKGFFNQPVYGSNEAILNATNNNIRLFTVERNPSLTPLDDVKGEWLCANPMTVKEFSAVGYFFGRKINSLLNIPIGLIHTSWGASNIETWMDEQTLSEFKEVEIVKEITSDKSQKLPVLLYNGMLHPLQNYAIKGTIWYQGESNSSDATEYSKLFPAMIKQWRKQWQQGDFPFYFVQIAPFGSDHRRGNSAYLREAQLKTMQTVRNTGMAVTLDIGNCDFIHPPEKRIVGERLAYWALAKDYNFEGVAWNYIFWQTFIRL